MLVRGPKQSQCCQSTMNGPWAPVSCWASSNSENWCGDNIKSLDFSVLLWVCTGNTNVCWFQPDFDPAGCVLQTLGELHVWNQQENLRSRAWARRWWLTGRGKKQKTKQIRPKKTIFTLWKGLSKEEMSQRESFRPRRLRPGRSDRSGARWAVSCCTRKSSNHDCKESPRECF